MDKKDLIKVFKIGILLSFVNWRNYRFSSIYFV